MAYHCVALFEPKMRIWGSLPSFIYPHFPTLPSPCAIATCTDFHIRGVVQHRRTFQSLKISSEEIKRKAQLILSDFLAQDFLPVNQKMPPRTSNEEIGRELFTLCSSSSSSVVVVLPVCRDDRQWPACGRVLQSASWVVSTACGRDVKCCWYPRDGPCWQSGWETFPTPAVC